MNHIIFEITSGRIDRVVSCATQDLPLQFDSATHAAIPGYVDDSRHYVAGDIAVEIPERPSTAHVFDFSIKAWVDPRTLSDHKVATWKRIKLARSAAIATPLVTQWGTFDCDTDSRAAISEALVLSYAKTDLGLAASIDFTLADNSVVRLLPKTLHKVAAALSDKIAVARNRAKVLRETINLATDKEQLDSIQW
jgi:Domain of unknown function (DUF4376)